MVEFSIKLLQTYKAAVAYHLSAGTVTKQSRARTLMQNLIISLWPAVNPPPRRLRLCRMWKLKYLSCPSALPHYPGRALLNPPLAWLSSTITIAPYFSAKSQMSFNLAVIPSIENTPSVAINFRGDRDGRPLACTTFGSFGCIRVFVAGCELLQHRFQIFHIPIFEPEPSALHKRMPSIMEAWFSSSLKTAPLLLK